MQNYLAGIVFAVLLAIGWLLLGGSLSQPGPNLLWPALWVLGSGLVASSIKIAVQWERALVFRLGKFNRLRGPGLYPIIPMIDQVRHIDTRIVTIDIPRQEAITKDNVPISIDGVIFMRVIRPDQAVINVQDYTHAITQYAQTALRDVIGGKTLDEVLTDREEIGRTIEELVERETEHWGLEVSGIRIQDIVLPDDLKRVMSRQAAAEREKRAVIAKSEGDRMAAENLAVAAAKMATSPGAMQLRTLQTIDGLGPTASNTVIMAVPLEIMEAFETLAKLRPKQEPGEE
ncbi:MAG: SPFH domain-containing protein [Armatimonadetes bacterium]|nr:SPFH domain-containing protein [Armatimonadota bacterium]